MIVLRSVFDAIRKYCGLCLRCFLISDNDVDGVMICKGR